MTTESIPIPADRVPPVATDMSSSSKVIAGVLFFFAVVFGFAGLGALSEEPARDEAPKNSAESAGRVIGILLFAGLPAIFGFRAARNASRATRAATLAKTEPGYGWRLAGKWIVVADNAGAPRPELSFKINGKLRTMLLAVPRAEVIEKT
jgi:hypothetical protein